jgi:HYR domain
LFAVAALLGLGLLAGCGNDVTPRALRPAAACEVVPPFTPTFEPEEEWHWTGSTILPAHRQVMMTPVVVDVSEDGIPDVVFNSFAGSNYTTNGVMRAISGADGRDIWTVTDPAYRVRGAASAAAGDIDSDGLVELCTVPESGSGIICFENTGAFKLRTTLPANNWGGPYLADLDGDGRVEIIAGNHVFSATGALRWVGVDGMGGHAATGPISFAADVDQNGMLEVVNGRAVYRHNGTLLCRNVTIGHGLAGVGNFDVDRFAEIAVVWSGMVSLLDHNCSLRWTTPLPGGGLGGAPSIADFDGDGAVEIGVAGQSFYSVFETNGAVRWSQLIQDASYSRTGSSAFDFEGDGRAEVVYADEAQLRIYDGTTGAVRFAVAHSSGTAYESPVIVDVDGDNSTEVVVIANDYASAGTAGIRVFRDASDGWVNTRRIWNQHAYSVTNVDEDGTIPAAPATNWLQPGLNTFRSNSQGTDTITPFAAADLTVTAVTAQCDRDNGALTLAATVQNLGDAAASANLPVTFYRGAPNAGGISLGTTFIPGVIQAGGTAVASLILDAPPGGSAEVVAVADAGPDGSGRELECHEQNNARNAQVDFGCTSNQLPVALCRDVTASAGDTCLADTDVDAGSYDPDQQPQPLVVTPAPAGPYAPGVHPVILTISDGEGTDQCTATVTVVDTTPPIVVGCGDLVVEAAPGATGAAVTYAPTATDNCDTIVPLACNAPSGSFFPLGQSSLVACAATDSAGNTAACSISVTVNNHTTCDQRDEREQDYWRAQCNTLSSGELPSDPSWTPDHLGFFLDRVAGDVQAVCDEAETTCQALNPEPYWDTCEQSCQHYAALVLNIETGFMPGSCCTLAGSGVEAAAQVASLIAAGNCVAAVELAYELNRGCSYCDPDH